jgi:uncharacterized protein (DUF736 family)
MSDWTKLGAFWKKTSESGKQFMAGEIEIDGKKTKITCWPNQKGDNPKRPDYIIYLDTYKAAPKPSGESFPGSPAADDDEIPF